MSQKRWFEVVRTDSLGVQRKTYVETHTPKDFLSDAILEPGEFAKPGKVYNLQSGQGCGSNPTIHYNKISSRAEFDRLVELQKAPGIQLESNGVDLSDFIEDQTGVISEVTIDGESFFVETPADVEPKVISVSRFACGVDDPNPSYSGATLLDDDALEALGVEGYGMFFDLPLLAKLTEAATAKGYTVVYADFEMPAPPLPEGAAASVTAPAAVAPLIPRPGRKGGRGVFGVVAKQRDTIARLERRIDQQRALLDNAKIREIELRIRFSEGK